MSGYKYLRRFIDLDTYQYNVKKQRRGNVKIEARDDKCKVSIYVSDVNLKPEEVLKAYMIKYDKGSMIAIPLGTLQVEHNIGQLKVSTARDKIMDSKYSIEDLSGVIVLKKDYVTEEIKRDVSYGGTWDGDIKISMDSFKEYNPKLWEQQRTIQPREEQFVTPITPQEPPRDSQDQELPVIPVEPEVPVEEELPETPQQPEVPVEPNDESGRINSETFIIRDPMELENEMDELEEEALDEEVEEIPIEDFDDEDEVYEIPDFEEPLRDGPGINRPDSEAPFFPDEDNFNEELDEEDVYPYPEDFYQNEAPIFADHTPPDQILKTQFDDHELSELHARMFNDYPKMSPFESCSDVIDCIRIEPKDIAALPINIWMLMNNTFLLNGYHKYKHLILYKIRDSSKDEGYRYILGVPGIYQKKDRFIAYLYGFNKFRCCADTYAKAGEYGYWTIDIGKHM